MKNKNKTLHHKAFVYSIAAFLLLAIAPPSARAVDVTWNGAGSDSRWQTGANWIGGNPPAANDSLFFTGTVRLSNTNNLLADIPFSGLTFVEPSGAFNLWGNSIVLAGGITNNQVVTPQTIRLPMTLSATRDVEVTANGILNITGELSGPGGLNKFGVGELSLGAANSFLGAISIYEGSTTISSDLSLGAVPATATPGSIVLDGGTLHITSDMTIDANRGIALGPTSGSGSGTIASDSGDDVVYHGVMTDNGGTGGLIKSGFGSLALSAANTYTGPTEIRVGTLTLDFTQPDSPTADVINSSSSLTLGGETSGAGTSSFDALVANGKEGVANSQTFSGTTVVLGQARIRANSGSGGSLTLNLGDLNHEVGSGAVVSIVPPAATGGAGSITTAATNVNGILGGWALYSDGTIDDGVQIANHFASVDGSGNIVPFTNYQVWTSGMLNDVAIPGANLLFELAANTVVRVDENDAGTVTDVNTITFTNTVNGGTSLAIGSGNTLRLGRYGAISRVNTTYTGADATYYIGGIDDTPQTGNGTTGTSSIGKVTAGGAPDSDGEIVLNLNATAPTSGGNIFQAEFADNGAGVVTVIKTGNSSSKIDGHNTFSGGLIIHAGRVQFAGSEIGSPNPDAAGTGPIYILPGGQLFPSGAAGTITNDMFVAGAGFNGNGLLRVSGGGTFQEFSGTITLIGDTFLGGNNSFNTNSLISGRITGDYSLGIGMNGGGENYGTCIVLANPDNDWSGNSVISCATSRGRNSTLILGADEVIPDGFGKGSLILRPNNQSGTGLARLEMDGYNETINGISVSPVNNGFPQQAVVQNNASGTTSTLTIGNNNVSSTFDGVLQNANGTLALTKIGGGILVLTRTNSYTGSTILNGGTLALQGIGSIASSAGITVNSNAAFDVSEVPGGFSFAQSVTLNEGTLVGNTAIAGINTLNMTNAAVTVMLDTTGDSITAGTLNVDAINLINIATVANVTSYPTQFVAIKYTSLNGNVDFDFGAVPSAKTGGYISNDTSISAIVVVLTNGPQSLTWTGNEGWDWDLASVNWLGFTGPTAFGQSDAVVFNNSALTNNVNIETIVEPSSMVINNSVDYTFVGSGAIGGFGGLTKSGSGTVTFLNEGPDTYRDGVNVNQGAIVLATDNQIVGGLTVASGAAVQMGTNGPSGTLPGGGIANEGSILFRNTTNVTYSGVISGAGTLTNDSTGQITLSGANTFTGPLAVEAGILRAGNGSALGTAAEGTYIATGARLDVNGQDLGGEPITAGGSGGDGLGVIVNNGAGATRSIRHLTLTGDTIFGGSARWDLRSSADDITDASLTGAFNITKVGSNQVSIVGVQVDSGLGDIIVQQGMLSVELGTDGLGDSTKSLVVSNGATLQLHGAAVELNKNYHLHGDGVANTLHVNNGNGNKLNGSITLYGDAILSSASANTTLEFNNSMTVSGTANVVKTGAGTNILGGSISYAGSTTVSNGTLVVRGFKSSGTGITVESAGVLSGGGSVSDNVIINGGLLPGDSAGGNTFGTLTISGDLTLNGNSNVFNLRPPGSGASASVASINNFTVNGTAWIVPVVSGFTPLNVGDTFTLFSFTSSNADTNNLQIVPIEGYEFHLETNANSVVLVVDFAVKQLRWVGSLSGGAWDKTLENWLKGPDFFTTAAFTDGDFTEFDDSASAKTVNITTEVSPAVMRFNNSQFGDAYVLTGSGRITGSGSVVLGNQLQQGVLVVANSGSNDFSGDIIIDSGRLQIGQGGAGGPLAFGIGSLYATNFSFGLGHMPVVVDRSDAVTLANNISGSITVSNVGTGVLTLSGNNSMTGSVYVANGTVAAGSATALGSTAGVEVRDTGFGWEIHAPNGSTLVETNASLDVNAQNLGSSPVVAQGEGFGGQGAIVNNSTNQQTQALRLLTLSGDITLGGKSRWDVRGGSLLTSPPNSAYSITKIDTNQISLVGITNIDPAINNIDIQAGLFGIETSTTQVGDPNGTITVRSNATLQMFNLNTPLNKVIDVKSGGTVGNASATSTIIGAMTLEGNVTFNATANAFLVLSNDVTDSGVTGLTKIGPGTVRFVGNEVPVPTQFLDLSAGTLDISEADSSLLSLSGTQIARGNGGLNGSLTLGSGTLLSPGAASGNTLGTLTVSNTLTASGSVYLELNRTNNGATNDSIVAGSLDLNGATVTVVNTGTPLLAGDTFRLFGVVPSGSYTLDPLPELDSGLEWTNKLDVDGTIQVLSVAPPAAPPQPTINQITTLGGEIIITGTNNNTSGGQDYFVLTSTNVALPLSNWTVLVTNTFNPDGSFSYTNTSEVNGQSFFIIQVP